MLESLEKFRESVEARIVGQHPLQSELRLPSVQRDTGPPWLLGVPRGVGRGPRQLPAILRQQAAMPRLWARFMRNRTLSVSNWTVSGTSFPPPFLTLIRHSRAFLPKNPVSPNLLLPLPCQLPFGSLTQERQLENCIFRTMQSFAQKARCPVHLFSARETRRLDSLNTTG